MCTGIFIQTQDGNYIFGRTLEFNMPLKWTRITGNNFKGTTGTYANQTLLVDGINKSGLVVGTFFFPHYGKYSTKHIDGKINLFTGKLNRYLLENCNNIDDIKRIAPRLNIQETIIDGYPLSVHWMACDLSGECIVIEVENDMVRIFENQLHILTNSPTFPQHLKTYSDYSYLSPYNKPHAISEGTGALGLPGDSSSVSRFVRAAFFIQNIISPKNIIEGMARVFGILHNFDIPIGSVVDKKTNIQEVTEYTVAYSLNNYEMEYAPYGFIKKGDEWHNTSTPVTGENDIDEYLIEYLKLILILILAILIYIY